MPAPFEQQVTFIYASDPERSWRFYGETLGLELALDQGACRIYRVAGREGFLGVCRARAETPPPPRFDHDRVVATSRRITARRRSAVLGGAMALLVVAGGMAGFFVVPMNALLQHRGHLLMGAGHSIAVQNFNENLSILLMQGCYAWMIGASYSYTVIVILFGLFIAGTMGWLYRRHGHDQDAGET